MSDVKWIKLSVNMFGLTKYEVVERQPLFNKIN